jgi:sigma-E factor negative regulatory protein RseC
MSEIGIVKEFDHVSNLLTIEFQAHGACKSCGMCLVGNGYDQSHMRIKAFNSIKAKVGDKVEFELKEGEMLKASMLLYAFPLGMLLIGFMLGRYVADVFSFSRDMISLLGAGLFFGLAFYLLSLREKKKAPDAVAQHIRLQKIAE